MILCPSVDRGRRAIYGETSTTESGSIASTDRERVSARQTRTIGGGKLCTLPRRATTSRVFSIGEMMGSDSRAAARLGTNVAFPTAPRSPSQDTPTRQGRGQLGYLGWLPRCHLTERGRHRLAPII